MSRIKQRAVQANTEPMGHRKRIKAIEHGLWYDDYRFHRPNGGLSRIRKHGKLRRVKPPWRMSGEEEDER